jgi:hypothetical protein
MGCSWASLSDPNSLSESRGQNLSSRRTADGTLMAACGAVTIVAFAEGARSLSGRGDSGNARLLIACAIMAAMRGGLQR